MESEIASGPLQRLLGVNKSLLNDLANHGIGRAIGRLDRRNREGPL
jgi:hypothetical protein